jgi:hypothetical protein
MLLWLVFVFAGFRKTENWAAMADRQVLPAARPGSCDGYLRPAQGAVGSGWHRVFTTLEQWAFRLSGRRWQGRTFSVRWSVATGDVLRGLDLPGPEDGPGDQRRGWTFLPG